MRNFFQFVLIALMCSYSLSVANEFPFSTKTPLRPHTKTTTHKPSTEAPTTESTLDPNSSTFEPSTETPETSTEAPTTESTLDPNSSTFEPSTELPTPSSTNVPDSTTSIPPTTTPKYTPTESMWIAIASVLAIIIVIGFICAGIKVFHNRAVNYEPIN